MTEYTWREFADATDAQVGDIIVDGTQVEYISDLQTYARLSNVTKYIQQERRVELTRYWHEFEWEDMPGAGYSFDCYSDGSFPEARDEKYFLEVKTKPGLKYYGVHHSTRHFFDPAVIECRVCKGDVILDMVLTNTCEKCGADYSRTGELLASREQWGEDTGESLSDILSADRSINAESWEFDYDD